ncbi:MAG: molecular chaperone TorD family protein [Desulfobacterales bacterium]|nr:molecular chaperone TorD family protein [Desulfobacterales bacterium]
MTIHLVPLYKIMSLGLSYPEEKNWEGIQDQIALSRDLFAGETATCLNCFTEYFFRNKHRVEEIQAEYLRIFDVGRNISPYETEYTLEKVSRKPFELADISGFYTAFGFGLRKDVRYKESLDHIGIELEFMAILAWKEEYARENNQQEHLAIVQDARKKFFQAHLARWGFFFCRRIAEIEGDDFFKRLARLLELVLTQECQGYALDATLFNQQMERDPYHGVRGEELTC